jgi:hypothetical protein
VAHQNSLTNKLVDLGSEVHDLHLTKKTKILKLAQELSMFGNHEKLTYPLPTSVSHTPNNTLSQAVWMIIMLIAVMLFFILPFSFDLFDSETHSMQNNTGLNKGYNKFKENYVLNNEEFKTTFLQGTINLSYSYLHKVLDNFL